MDDFVFVKALGFEIKVFMEYSVLLEFQFSLKQFFYAIRGMLNVECFSAIK